jgi:hypothetical protein
MKFHEHPLNKEIGDFQGWLLDQVMSKKITPEQNQIINRAARQPFIASGLPKGPDADPVSIAVFRQVLHVMKTKTIELCPQLADEVRSFSSGRSR